LNKISITDLLAAGVHLGHPTKRWNPKMKPYIHCARNGIYIFDLTKTMQSLDATCRHLYEVVASGGSVLFVGTKRQAQDVVREAAEKTGQYYMVERWLGGTLTNNQTIRKSVKRMDAIQKMEDDGELAQRSKKEASRLRREHSKLHRNLAGIRDMRSMPDVLVVIDVDREDIAIREAKRLGLQIIGLVDTNCNPDSVDYIIPGNDDALRSIKIVVDALTDTITAARQIYEKRLEQERKEKERKDKEAREAREAAAAAAEAEKAEKAEKGEEEAAEKPKTKKKAKKKPVKKVEETPAAKEPAAEEAAEESEAADAETAASAE
jgi:small subunit ribosomal protein S2